MSLVNPCFIQTVYLHCNNHDKTTLIKFMVFVTLLSLVSYWKIYFCLKMDFIYTSIIIICWSEFLLVCLNTFYYKWFDFIEWYIIIRNNAPAHTILLYSTKNFVPPFHHLYLKSMLFEILSIDHLLPLNSKLPSFLQRIPLLSEILP